MPTARTLETTSLQPYPHHVDVLGLITLAAGSNLELDC